MLKLLVYDAEQFVWNATLEGDLDIYHAAKMLERIQAAVKEHPAKINFDCSKLAYVDSMGLGALIKVNTLVKEEGGIRLYHMSPLIYKLFVLTKLETLFEVEVIE